MLFQTLGEIEQELRQGRFRPVYLVGGAEEYLIDRALNLLRREAVAADALAFNYSEFSAKVHSIHEILDAAYTFPMMSPMRLVLVADAERLTSTDSDVVAAYLKQPALKSVLVFVMSSLDKRTSFFKLMNDNACVLELAKLKGPALERWAEETFRRRGYRISSAALRKMVELAGSDLQALSTEIEKALLYAGEAKIVPDSVIDELVHASRQYGIFELTGALGKHDRPAAIKLLGNLLECGEHPLVIVSMMARHFRQVLITQELLDQGRPTREVAAAAQVPGFVLNEFIRQVRAMDRGTAERMYGALAEIDHRFKSSSVDQRMVLESLICSL